MVNDNLQNLHKMITSGKQFEYITEKIAALQLEITAASKRGLTNLNKHCENFVKRLLNITYGYRLENLNKGTAKFPGLDLGSKGDKIAYQVTSERSSTKVEETLETVERHQHYLQYPSIRMFMLCGKQKTYSIEAPAHFEFDTDSDIQDFNDLLADIQNLESEQIKEVYQFIEGELDDQINRLKNNAQRTTYPSSALINIENSIKSCGLNYFSHFAFRVQLQGKAFSMPTLYHNLDEIVTREVRMSLMNILLAGGGRPALDAQTAYYRDGPRSTGASNRFLENVLEIKENSFRYEVAAYQDQELLLDNLSRGVFTLLTLLFFCERICGKEALDLVVDVDLSSNGHLLFHNQSSPLSVNGAMEDYELNPPELRYSRQVRDTSDETLIELLEPLIQGFVNVAEGPLAGAPFFKIDKPQQSAVFNFIRNKFMVPLSKL